jgi:hypothetical protein
LLLASLLIGGAGLRLACEAGLVYLPLCGSDAPITAALTAVEIAGGQAVVTVTEDDGDHIASIHEPADQFASQFTKFVVVAPDGGATLHVTASSLAMTSARLWLTPRGGAKRLLKELGDDFWVARPVWCQARSGDPGRIAYVMRAPPGPGRTGLELWTIGADGTGDRRVLVGTAENGFAPDLFYGHRPTPLRFLNGCQRLRYSNAGEDDHAVVDLDTGTVSAPLVTPGPAALATAIGATPVATHAAPAAPPCLVKPFAQTDPRWAYHLMLAGHTTIRAWGCALTSTAMLFHYYGVDTDPGRLADCAGDEADPLHWEPVRARCAAGRVTSLARWTDQVTWADLEAALAPGRPVIVGLQGGPAGSHFVVVTAGSGDQAASYHIVDSWDGSTYKTLADYTNPRHGYRLRWLIVFDGVPPRCRPPTPGPTGPPVITFLSPADAGVYNTPQTVRYHVSAARPDATISASHPDGTVIAAEGPVVVTVTVEDGAETYHRRMSFLIDRTPPVVSAAWELLSETTVRLSLTADDNLTAIAEAHYRVDDGPWQPVLLNTAASHDLGLSPVTVDVATPGRHRLRYYAVDAAGNRGDEGELVITAGPPALSVLLDGAPLPLDAPVVAFASDQAERSLTLLNHGQSPVTIALALTDLPPWAGATVTPAPAGGRAIAAPDAAVTLRLWLRPDRLPPGRHLATLPLTLAPPERRLLLTLAATGDTPAGPAPPGDKPDLVATLRPRGAPRLTTRGAEAPVRVTVVNQGRQGAAATHLVAHYTSRAGAAEAPFFTSAGDGPVPAVPPLAAGARLVFDGVIVVPLALAGTTVSLSATVDHCDGESRSSPACQVEEANEANNRSDGQGVTIPAPAPALAELAGDGLGRPPAGTPYAAALPAAGDGVTLAVTGGGFTPASAVHWNGRPLPTRFLGAARLAANLPAAALARPGVARVAVVTPPPGGGVSNALAVLIEPSAPAEAGPPARRRR